jgi:hypothetical protein
MAGGKAGRRAARAPRLSAGEFIAPHMTRVGRFRKINPLKPRKLPAVSRILGAVAWAVFLEETVRRASKIAKTEPAAD